MLWCMLVVLLKKTCTHLTALLYVSHFLCVYHVQFDVESDFAWNGFAAAWKLKLLYSACLVSMWTSKWELYNGLLYNSVATWSWEGAGMKDSYYTAGGSLSMSIAGLLSYQISQAGCACILDLDSWALALTKQMPGNSRLQCSLVCQLKRSVCQGGR